MKKGILSACLVVCMCCTVAMAQDESPKGKAIIQVFGNVHTGFGETRNDRGFDLDRSYLGYLYDLGKGLCFKGVVDIGAKTDDNDRVVFIKHAQATWKKNKWTLNGGMISTTQFNMVEKFWGYRYLYKSFQDEYKFGCSADLGLSVDWQATDWVSLDAIIVNGEGFKKVQFKDGFLYGLGATFTPVKGLSMRLYAGINEQVGEGKSDTWNYAAFVGYKHDKFSLGAEYNYMQNCKGVSGNDRYGFSLYGSVKVAKRAELLARYDNLSSRDDWSVADDEAVALLGAQLKFGKYVKVAPNLRMTMPKADGEDNRYAAYVSCYFGL